SDAERLQIQMARKGFDNDLAGQLVLGQQLVQQYPQSPRAWLALAGAQTGLNKNEDARVSIAKALELSPKLYVAHATMGNDYIFGEPHDFTKALAHMQEAEALAPGEANAHLLVGDAYRAQRNLEKARDEYLRGRGAGVDAARTVTDAASGRGRKPSVQAGATGTDRVPRRVDRGTPRGLCVGPEAGRSHYPAARPRREPAQARADAPAGGIHRALSGQVQGSGHTPAAGQPVGPVHQVSVCSRHRERRRRRAGQAAVPGDRRLQ